MIVLYLVRSGNVLADVTELEDFFRPDQFVVGGQSGMRIVYATFLGTIMLGVLDVITTYYCSKNISFGKDWSVNYETGFLQDDKKDNKENLENGICQDAEDQKIKKAIEENGIFTVQTKEQENYELK